MLWWWSSQSNPTSDARWSIAFTATRRPGGFWIGQQAPVARCARSFCMTPIKEFMRRKARKTSPSSAQSALATIRCSKAGCIGRIRLATERIPCLSRCWDALSGSNPMPVKHRAASSRPYLSSTRKATTTTANQTSVKQDKNAITAR